MQHVADPKQNWNTGTNTRVRSAKTHATAYGWISQYVSWWERALCHGENRAYSRGDTKDRYNPLGVLFSSVIRFRHSEWEGLTPTILSTSLDRISVILYLPMRSFIDIAHISYASTLLFLAIANGYCERALAFRRRQKMTRVTLHSKYSS